MTSKKIIKELASLKNQKQAIILQRFFKTAPGEYGEWDIFLGIKIPTQRKVAKMYKSLSLKEIQTLLDSKIHEHRMVALFILIDNYKKSDEKNKKFVSNITFFIDNKLASQNTQ